MSHIRNKNKILENSTTQADRKVRDAILLAYESALLSSNPYQLIIDNVSVSESILTIGSKQFDLNKFENIIVIGGGKASGSMTQALENLLEGRITNGIVNILVGTSDNYPTKKVHLNEAGHPIPTENGMLGAKKMLDLAENAGKEDLIICLISGGGSAMMASPKEGITLKDKQTVTQQLLHSGATINELNAVRKHLSDFKGGWLAKRAQPATLVSLILSDVVGDPLDTISSGPTAPDQTTYQDVVDIFDKYKLSKEIPISIKKILEMGLNGKISETPKSNDSVFDNVHNIVLGNNRLACLAAKEKLSELGFNTLFLTSYMEGEAKDIGIFLGAIANEIFSSGNPIPRPAAVIVGGETTVTVRGKGLGGRNQEIVLSAASKINGMEGVGVASIGTDGIDGPTDAAGAIADGKSLLRAKQFGLNNKKMLNNNDSYNFFSKIGDLIITGPTGSNVNDIALVCMI
ncbi:glycerate kinase type-2 family protein [[Eubacterium] cellulosolvens]